MMRWLPLILAYGALCTGMAAGAMVLLPKVHPGQEATAAPVTNLQHAAGERIPTDMEAQANRLAERAQLDALFAQARPPVPMLPSPKPVFIPVQTAAMTAATAVPPVAATPPTAAATSVASAQPGLTPSNASADTTVLRPPSSVAPASVAKYVETDGYKGVRVLGREADGRWRAVALRGNTEVAVLVDDKGTVSTQ
jgi:hypothetical protein